MPRFEYQGREEKSGTLVAGQREAASHAALGQQLLSEGILLTRYQEARISALTRWQGYITHVPVLERVLFARYFALMIRAGLDVEQALVALSEQTHNKVMRAAINGVATAVERGETLAAGMQSYPHAFPVLFVSFIRVGEATGRLQESLEILAKQMQKEYEMRRAVRGGMLYPAVIVAALIAVAFAMLVFVVPKLADVFSGFNVELPLMTRLLLATGTFFAGYWWFVIIMGVVVAFGVWGLMKIAAVKNAFMQMWLYVPIIGSIMRQVNLARFARSLSSLLASGVTFVEGLSILGTNTPHASYARVFLAGAEHVKKGKLLSEFLQETPRLFPPLIVNIIKVGEQTGSIADVLLEVATFYEGEVDQVMKNLTSIIEPVLMVVIGLAVGALAVSVISPIYNLVNVI